MKLVILSYLFLSLISCDHKGPESAVGNVPSGDQRVYPYYNKNDLANRCQNPSVLPEIDVTRLTNLKKIFVFPKERRKFVAGFANDFLVILESKGWQVVDAANPSWTDSMSNDLKNPDVVVFYMTDFLEKTHYFYRKFWKDIQNNKTVKILISEDLNEGQNTDLVSFFNLHGDAILARYPEALTKVLSKSSSHAPCYEFYHAASRHYFENQLEFTAKADTALLSGALTPAFYPLRTAANELYMRKIPYMEFRKHPGYDTIPDPIAEAVSYAKQIARNKIAITGAGMGKTPAPYILAKTFEIPATGTVVVMDDFVEPMMNKLGFQRNIHYISTNPEYLQSDLEFWFHPENSAKLEKISKAGYRLVLERHTLEKRVEEFEKIVAHVVSNK